MSVSVIVPSYNRAHCISRALESIRAQTFVPQEIIVVDDGSTDKTRELVTKSYPEASYLYQSHLGVSAARNKGVAHASCEWIAFLDSDDSWFTEKLNIQLAALKNNPGYLIHHCDEIWIRNGKRVNPMNKHRKRGGWIYAHCLPLCAISPSTVIIDRELFLREKGFNQDLPACEDYDLWLRLCAKYPVLYTDQHLVTRFGGHVDQLSKKYWGMDRFRVASLENILQTGILDQENQKKTLETLVKKLQILINGARKRDNKKILQQYQSKLRQYAGLLRYISESC